MVFLKPEDVCLNACCEAAASESLGDDVPACLAVVAAFQHYVDAVLLVCVETERDYAVGVIDIADTVFGNGPVSEVMNLSELVESTASFMYALTVEDGKRGITVKEALDLREDFHCKGKEQGAVGYGRDAETEAESGGLEAGALVGGITFHMLFWMQR